MMTSKFRQDALADRVIAMLPPGLRPLSTVTTWSIKFEKDGTVTLIEEYEQC